MLKCPFCKAEVLPNSAFCINCGRDIRAYKQSISYEPMQEHSAESDQLVPPVANNKLARYFNILILSTATLCIAAFIIFSIREKLSSTADKNVANEKIIGNLYRNTKYKFRIKFPKNWQIKNGDGPNVLVKATDGNTSTILILVKDIGVKMGDIDNLYSLNEWSKSMEEKVMSVKILEKRPTSIDNKKAYFGKYSVTYSSLDKKIDMTGFIVALTYSNFMYTIMAGTSMAEFKNKEPILSSSIRTFVVEDY